MVLHKTLCPFGTVIALPTVEADILFPSPLDSEVIGQALDTLDETVIDTGASNPIDGSRIAAPGTNDEQPLKRDPMALIRSGTMVA
jgi:hypothetical protein